MGILHSDYFNRRNAIPIEATIIFSGYRLVCRPEQESKGVRQINREISFMVSLEFMAAGLREVSNGVERFCCPEFIEPPPY
jgi:hypothetical protein